MKEIKVDLHIHTPASHDYHNRKDSEYLDILKSAHESGISLIAFTDHFSVDGFEYIQNYIESTKTTYDNLLKRGDAGKELLSQLEDEISLFISVKLLMGIELDISGIHFIVIFSEDITPDLVRAFLEEITDNDIKNHWGDPNYMIDKSFNEITKELEHEFKESFFIYAPHIDSAKGVIESLKQNQKLRESIFKGESLAAIAYNKPQTKQWLLTDYFPNLSLKQQPALIQESDYHGKKGQKIGHSYFTFESDSKDVNFIDLLQALRANKKIKTSLDYVDKEYKEFEKENSPIFDISFEDEDKIAMYSAGIFNSRIGCLRIEVPLDQSKDQKIIIEDSINKLNAIILSKLDIQDRYLIPKVFPLSKGKLILVIFLQHLKKLLLYESKVFVVDKKENCIRCANSSEIESIVSRNTYERFAKPKDRLIKDINRNSNKVKNYLLSFSLFFKIQDKLKMNENIKIEFHNASNNELTQLDELMDKFPNGQHKGNLVFIKDSFEIDHGRLRHHKEKTYHSEIEHSYLRVIAPKIDYPNEEELMDLESFEEDRIIIIPRGGSFIYKANQKIYSFFPYFTLHSTSSESSFDIKFFAGYFKSSFFQWFISKIYTFEELYDFFLSNMHRRLPFIYTFESEIRNQIVTDINNIIVDEDKFLKEEDKLIISGDPKNKLSTLTNDHNKQCNKAFRKLDQHLFMNLDLIHEEILQIYKDMNTLDIYDYDALENFENTYKH